MKLRLLFAVVDRLRVGFASLAFYLRNEFRFAHSDFAFRLRLHRVPFGLRSVPSLRLLASLSVPSKLRLPFSASFSVPSNFSLFGLTFRFPQAFAFRFRFAHMHAI